MIGAEEIQAGLGVASWFESKANIVAVVLGIVNLCQLGLGLYRDWRHKQICIELGNSWIVEVQKWGTRIDQMRADTKEAFGNVREITSEGSGVREKIAVSLTQVSETLRSQEKTLERLAQDIRDSTRMSGRQ